MKFRMRKNRELQRKTSGFTLVEMIVTLLVLAIVAAISVPALLGFIDEGHAKQCEANKKALAEEIVSARMAYEVNGKNAEEGKTGKEFDEDKVIASSNLKCPTKGEYTYDPTTDEIVCEEHGRLKLPNSGKYDVSVKDVSQTEAKASSEPLKPSGESTPGTSEDASSPTPSEEPTPGTSEDTQTPTEASTEAPPKEPTVTPTEKPSPSPTATPTSSPDRNQKEIGDNSFFEVNGQKFEVGTWEQFREDLAAWKEQYKLIDDSNVGKEPYSLQVYSEINPETNELELWVVAGTSLNVDEDIKNETVKQYNESHDTQLAKVRLDPIYDYTKIKEDTERVKDLSEEEQKKVVKTSDRVEGGTVVFYDGVYYVAGPGGANFINVEDAVPYGNSAWWPLRPYCNVARKEVSIDGNVYTAVIDAEDMAELDSDQVKWFDPGQLLRVNGELYVNNRVTKVSGGMTPDEYLNNFTKVTLTDTVIDFDRIPENDWETKNTVAKLGQVVRWKGRDYVCIKEDPRATINSVQWKQYWELLR